MAYAYTAAENAIYAEIERQVKKIADESYGGPQDAAALKDLAVAFRLTYGGPQPGGSVVSN